MKVLIAGAQGQLGWELQRTVPPHIECIAPEEKDFDITDPGIVDQTVAQWEPDVVVNAAAYTAVDKAEEEENLAYRINADGAAHLARVSTERKARLIHISTDFVFDGNQSTPYLPTDTPSPLNVYGASKLKGEEEVAAITDGQALIFRTAWVYSVRGNNFVKTMLRLMAERQRISVVADQIGTPTWANELAKVIWQVFNRTDLSGIYHWTDAGVASWYDFAVAIQDEALARGMLERPITVQPIGTSDYPTQAKRPPYSVLDKGATWAVLGYTGLHWRTALQQMLKDLKEEHHA
ncbi:MAG: dTDP-4-dehydrorhamnose reductase [bacterium]|nr:dTDP-4-dehydrorhamnose reductase [bacterium]